MKKMILVCLAVLLLVVTVSGCGSDAPSVDTSEVPTFELSSPIFADGAAIPQKCTCDGDDISPPLAWQDPPSGTQSLALIVDDPDAPRGTWVHWVLYNLPAETRALPEALPSDAELPDGSRYGVNSWQRLDYGGYSSAATMK